MMLTQEQIDECVECIARHLSDKIGRVRWASKPLAEPIDWQAEVRAALAPTVGDA